LKAARLESGLSQEKVAQALGVSEKTVRRWEAGGNPVKRLWLKPLADLFEVQPADLLADEEAAVA
jgi:transcriptional regulator with XRE-family HTH domain